jgi:hypothetical protein
MDLPDSPPSEQPLQPPTRAMFLGPITGEAPSVMPRPGVTLPAGTMLTGRTVVGMVLLFVAGVSIVLGASAGWTRSQLLDSSTWTATSTAIAADPAVQNDVAAAITDQIMASADVEAAIRSALPGPLGSLAGPLTDGASALIERAVVQVVRTDAFVSVWSTAVSAAHEEFVADLDGRGRVTSIGPEGLYLDLGAVLGTVRQALDDSGITVLDSIDLSGVSVRILLVDAPGLDHVRTTVEVLGVAVIVLPVLALCCLVAGLLVARRRWFAMIGAGVGVLVGVTTVLVIEFFGRQRAVDELVGGVLDRGGATAVVDHVTASLRPLMLLWALVGVLIAVICGAIVIAAERRRGRSDVVAP